MAQSSPDFLRTVCGFADFGVLTAQGQLSFTAGSTADPAEGALMETLETQSRDFLRAYLRQPDMPGWRLALIHKSPNPDPRDPITLCFETEVIRQLYRVTDRVTGALTGFQQKNRHKGICHGIALLLSQYPDIAPETPLYCPILFDRHTTLGHYAEMLEQTAAPEHVDTPVLEVLNLAAPLALNQRDNPAILVLRKRLERSLPMQDAHGAPDFSILDSLLLQQAPESTANAEYYGVDKRSDRDVTLSAQDMRQIHLTSHHEPVEHWLEHPHRTVSAARLQQFTHFRDLDPTRLAMLVARSFVYTAAPGSTLLERGMTDRWNMYLLEGNVLLTAADGAGFVVEGGSAKAGNPIAFLKPRKYAVATLTKVSFLWIHDVLLRVLCVGTRREKDPEAAAHTETERNPGSDGPSDAPGKR